MRHAAGSGLVSRQSAWLAATFLSASFALAPPPLRAQGADPDRCVGSDGTVSSECRPCRPCARQARDDSLIRTQSLNSYESTCPGSTECEAEAVTLTPECCPDHGDAPVLGEGGIARIAQNLWVAWAVWSTRVPDVDAQWNSVVDENAREPGPLDLQAFAGSVCPFAADREPAHCPRDEHDETEELIDRILARRAAEQLRYGEIRSASLFEPAGVSPDGIRHHRVGYQEPASGAGFSTVFEAPRAPIDWSSASGLTLSFHFQGATVEEVASYFHIATGMTVRVQLPTASEQLIPAGIHVRCRDKSAEQGLRVALGSCGLGYAVRGGALMIALPEQIEAWRQAIPLDAHWSP